MSEDRYRPSRATSEGQFIHLAGSLSGAGRTGKVVAYLWLGGLLLVGVVVAVAVIASL